MLRWDFSGRFKKWNYYIYFKSSGAMVAIFLKNGSCQCALSFWQLRPYVVLHHVEFKESSFSFSSVGIINFVDIVGFVRKNDTFLGILLRNGCFYLFSAVSMDRQCILVCDPEFYKQTGRRLGGWSLFVMKRNYCGEK